MALEPEADTASQPPPAAPPPAPSGPVSGPPPTPEATDRSYVRALQGAGLMAELSEMLMAVLLDSVEPHEDEDARHLDLLELYYAGGDAEDVATRRRAADRFFVHHAEDVVNAHQLVSRLSALVPEIGTVSLERIGSDDGPLVLRAGEHFSAVVDEPEEEEMDTGQIDLTELEPETSITVRGLVGSINVLLDRNDVRSRLVPLTSDGEREAYVCCGVAEAMVLCRDGYLEAEDPERLMEFCAW